MDQFEEKLNSILSSPETMGQIMALASSLSGGGDEGAPPSEAADRPEAPKTDLSALLQGLDDGMVPKLMALWGECNRGADDKTRLLEAMKPFLRQERQEKLDRAVQIARLSRVIHAALEQFRGDTHV